MIQKAIKHLKWRFGQDRINVSQKDIDALKDIIEMYNSVEEQALSNQKLFIKLFIDSFLKHTVITGKTSKQTIKEMERLLAIPVSEYYAKMKEEIPYLRFNAVLEEKDIIPLYEFKNGSIKVNNSEAVFSANSKKIIKNQKLLAQALTKEYTDAELKSFLDTHMFSLILKYSKHD